MGRATGSTSRAKAPCSSSCSAAGTSRARTATSARPRRWQRKRTMPLETFPYDSAELLDTPDAVAAYLEAAFETDDPAFITKALGVVARAKGMTQIAKDAGLSRESLYRALGENGNPEFSTVLKVAKALGLRLAVVAAE